MHPRLSHPRKDQVLEESGQGLDAAEVAALYAAHADQLQRFLWGVLRDRSLVQDVLQATFVKLVERGGESREESRKAWLFRVAYNEALSIRRREAIGDKVVRKVASAAEQLPSDELVRFETVQVVRKAIDELPESQRQIVILRIYEEKTFAQIAEELQIPLGTALSRMRAAVSKLKDRLDQRES